MTLLLSSKQVIYTHLDVGIAMGISGTEITKQAADFVLANDHFATIVDAIEEGRRVFDNIVKFIVYLLSCNSAEILLMLLSAFFNVPPPYTANSTLWANIIADVPPAMSLGVEPMEMGLMGRPPRDPKAHVVNRYITLVIVLQGSLLTLIAFSIYMTSLVYFPVDMSRTITFTSLTTMQLVQSFWSKSIYQSVLRSGITSNRWMIYAFFLSFSLMVMGIYTPGLNQFLTLVPMNGYGWIAVVLAMVLQFVLIEMFKAGLRRRTK